jgi:hypothetical protein
MRISLMVHFRRKPLDKVFRKFNIRCDAIKQLGENAAYSFCLVSTLYLYLFRLQQLCLHYYYHHNTFLWLTSRLTISFI